MWKKVLFANLLFFAACFVVSDSLFGIALPRGERVTVPDFCGVSERSAAADETFEFTAEYRYDNSPAGTILSQEPPAGSIRKVGEDRARCKVRVVVSMGPEQVTLPDLVGQNGGVAAAELRRMGLVVTTAPDPSAAPTTAAGEVTAMSPAAGSVLQSGAAVRLYLSPGGVEYED